MNKRGHQGGARTLAGKRGQLTIFVILGIALIVLVFMTFFLFYSKEPIQQTNPLTRQAPRTNSQEFIQGCVEPHLDEAIEKINQQGGYIYNKLPSLVYQFENISYLCHTSSFDDNCVNLEPVFIGAVQEEIESYLSPKVEECFNEFLKVYSEYEVVVDSTELDVLILPERVSVDLQKNIRIIEEGSEILFEDFSFEINSPLHTFLSMASETSNRETMCSCGTESCNSDYFSMDRFNPGFITSRFTGNFGERVYTIEYLRTGDKFNFAIRNCIDDI